MNIHSAKLVSVGSKNEAADEIFVTSNKHFGEAFRPDPVSLGGHPRDNEE